MSTHEQIDRIIRLDGRGLPVVSLYVTVEPDGSPHTDGDVLTRVNSLLDPVRALEKDRSVPAGARRSLHADLERITRAAADSRWKPGMMALFSCGGLGFFEEVSLPRPVRDRLVVDGTPWVRPMLAVLQQYRRMCVLIADDAAAQVWELHQREIREVRQLRDPSLRKPDYSYGMVEHRIHNKGEELAKRHHRRVAATLGDLFRAEGFDLLAVGGHPHQVSTVTGFLPRELRDRLAGTFVIDAATATPADVRHAAEAVMDAYEQREQQALVAEITEAFAERRPAALGLEPCLWAGSVSAIDRLAVTEGAEAPGVVCDADGWMALTGQACPLCGGPTRATADVVDELIEAVTNDSGTVRHVGTGTDLREHGLGARLRFPLPPRPAAVA